MPKFNTGVRSQLIDPLLPLTAFNKIPIIAGIINAFFLIDGAGEAEETEAVLAERLVDASTASKEIINATIAREVDVIGLP